MAEEDQPTIARFLEKALAQQEELGRQISFAHALSNAAEGIRSALEYASGEQANHLCTIISQLEHMIPTSEVVGLAMPNHTTHAEGTAQTENAAQGDNQQDEDLSGQKGKASKPVKGPKRFEPPPNMRKLVETIQGMTRYPDTFEEVLEVTFGPEWRSRKHSAVRGSKELPEVVAYGEEITRPNSQVRKQLRNTFENIYLAVSNKVPEGYQQTELMRGFVERARKKTYATVDKRLRSWGI